MITTYIEMPFECFSTHVHEVATDFTWIFFSQAMQFPQPKWDRLSIPSDRKFQWIVKFFFILVIRIYHDFYLLLFLAFMSAPKLL
jgi:hypothetical protein